MSKKKRQSTNKTFTIRNDLFCFEIDVYIGEWNDYCKWRACRYPNYDFDERIEGTGAIFHPGCVRTGQQVPVGVLWLPKNATARIITHEAIHAAGWVYRNKALGNGPMDEYNEVFAYLTGDIVANICEKLNAG